MGYANRLPLCFSPAGISPPLGCISLSCRALLADSPRCGRSRDNHHFGTLSFVSAADRLLLTVLATTKEKFVA